MEIFWFVLGGIALAIVIATVTILVGRNPELPEAETAAELDAPAEDTAVDVGVEAEAVAPTQEDVAAERDVPEPVSSRLSRLRRRLSASNNPFARSLLSVLSADRLDAEAWDDLEATLISADLGVGPTEELVSALRRELSIDGVNDPETARRALRTELLRLVGTEADRSLNLTGADGVPGVVLVVGVNGTGKTTTIGKLSRVLVAEGHSVLLAAADTFRAAAGVPGWGSRWCAVLRAAIRPRLPSMHWLKASNPGWTWLWSIPQAVCTPNPGSWTNWARSSA